jgi:hypothetical protein
MACPFSGAKAPAEGSTSGSGCPFAKLFSRPAGAGADGAAAPADVAPPAAAAIDAAASDPAPATCPYGFGSSKGGGSKKLSELHCLICSALFHDAHAAQPCGHRYCRACLARARDCPACGRDVESAAPAPELQGTLCMHAWMHMHACGLFIDLHAAACMLHSPPCNRSMQLCV